MPKRGEMIPAHKDQLVSYILVDRTYFRHRTIETARAERAYLEAKTGKQFKLLKIVHCSSEELLSGDVQVSRSGVPFDPSTGKLKKDDTP
jgi:hypothetical protein